ncbi:hypothetical protein L596_012146 [Steinernema carpocapsae]|uniref:Uncharacterized protein n=1 Tax=Steinernema carpocapsae TaxID=34508 RepID=A0A4U5NX14_STECR|nr:hypothetical protein L596_012146 [Steinernema carpocapsae]
MWLQIVGAFAVTALTLGSWLIGGAQQGKELDPAAKEELNAAKVSKRRIGSGESVGPERHMEIAKAAVSRNAASPTAIPDDKKSAKVHYAKRGITTNNHGLSTETTKEDSADLRTAEDRPPPASTPNRNGRSVEDSTKRRKKSGSRRRLLNGIVTDTKEFLHDTTRNIKQKSKSLRKRQSNANLANSDTGMDSDVKNSPNQEAAEGAAKTCVDTIRQEVKEGKPEAKAEGKESKDKSPETKEVKDAKDSKDKQPEAKTPNSNASGSGKDKKADKATEKNPFVTPSPFTDKAPFFEKPKAHTPRKAKHGDTQDSTEYENDAVCPVKARMKKHEMPLASESPGAEMERRVKIRKKKPKEPQEEEKDGTVFEEINAPFAPAATKMKRRKMFSGDLLIEDEKPDVPVKAVIEPGQREKKNKKSKRKPKKKSQKIEEPTEFQKVQGGLRPAVVLVRKKKSSVNQDEIEGCSKKAAKNPVKQKIKEHQTAEKTVFEKISGNVKPAVVHAKTGKKVVETEEVEADTATAKWSMELIEEGPRATTPPRAESTLAEVTATSPAIEIDEDELTAGNENTEVSEGEDGPEEVYFLSNTPTLEAQPNVPKKSRRFHREGEE